MKYQELLDRVLPGHTYKNINGSIYNCIKVNRRYALFQEQGCDNFIVAWLPKLYTNTETGETPLLAWQQGHYFNRDLQGASEFIAREE